MESVTRGKFLIAGSIIAFLGFVVPGLYGVAFDPPQGSPYAGINLSSLDGFGGIISSSDSAAYNGFEGPADLHYALIAIIIMAAQGLLARKVDINLAGRFLRWLFGGVALLKAIFYLGSFIWAFRFDHAPQAVVDRFVSDLGGGQQAIDASQYLQGELGASSLVVAVGFIIGSYGDSKSLVVGIGVTILAAILVLLIATGVLA